MRISACYGWEISSQLGNSYYSAAALSGAHGGKAFFFRALGAGDYNNPDTLLVLLLVLAARALQQPDHGGTLAAFQGTILSNSTIQ